MSYASKQDMIDAFSEKELKQLTDREAAAVIDDAVLAKALVAADAEIDTYLAKRVATPLSPVPVIVNSHACAIARYKLHKDSVPEVVRNGYTDALAWLKRAAAGEVSIDGLASSPTATTADMPLVDAPARVFGRDDMKVW